MIPTNTNSSVVPAPLPYSEVNGIPHTRNKQVSPAKLYSGTSFSKDAEEIS